MLNFNVTFFQQLSIKKFRLSTIILAKHLIENKWLYIYKNRIQKERFQSQAEYKTSIGQYVLNPHLMTKAKKQMAVLHTLPR